MSRLRLTYTFPGAEYWCPYCGYTGGFLGSGEDVERTPELEKEKEKWATKSRPYLRAIGRKVCTSFIYNNKRITYTELPQEEKDKDNEIIKNWQHEAKTKA